MCWGVGEFAFDDGGFDDFADGVAQCANAAPLWMVGSRVGFIPARRLTFSAIRCVRDAKIAASFSPAVLLGLAASVSLMDSETVHFQPEMRCSAIAPWKGSVGTSRLW